MTILELREQLKSYPDDLKITREFLTEFIDKKRNRSSGKKYKKSVKKEKLLLTKLKNLVYSNYNLTNIELAKKLEISKVHFYRLKFNIIAKDLKVICRKESLFK